jgi:hypothetical protein
MHTAGHDLPLRSRGIARPDQDPDLEKRDPFVMGKLANLGKRRLKVPLNVITEGL